MEGMWFHAGLRAAYYAGVCVYANSLAYLRILCAKVGDGNALLKIQWSHAALYEPPAMQWLLRLNQLYDEEDTHYGS